MWEAGKSKTKEATNSVSRADLRFTWCLSAVLTWQEVLEKGENRGEPCPHVAEDMRGKIPHALKGTYWSPAKSPPRNTITSLYYYTGY